MSKLRPFEYHGVHFTSSKDDHSWGMCPFCEHPHNKFSVNESTGQWDCKHCSRTGNIYSFLSQWHQVWLDETTDDYYQELAEDRQGIPWRSFKTHKFAWDNNNERWLIPIYNTRSSIVNLRTHVPESPIFSTAGLPHHLYRLEHLNGEGPIFLCEGEWDALALEDYRTRANVRGSVLAAPGASVFKTEWASLFESREVFLLYDNDTSGEDGVKRVTEILSSHVHSLSVLQWPSDTPSGFDIRDFIIANPKSPKNSFNDLLRCCQTTHGSKPHATSHIKIPNRTSFSEIISDFSKFYHFDQHFIDGLALMLAVIFSIQLPGDPLWLFIVGPPGSGKTLLLRSFQQSPYAYFCSSLTPRSLVSGFTPAGGGDSDPSLIPLLQGKTLVIKDYTEHMTLPRGEQDEIYGILRGAFDGFVEKSFGNGIRRRYPDCYFAILAGVTDEIHADNRASLGERFLKYQFLDCVNSSYDPDQHIRSALSSMSEQFESEHFLRGVVSVFTNREIQPSQIPLPPMWLVNRIVALSQVIALCRATVHRSYNGDPTHRPTIEIGTRLAKQLLKLTQSLAIVFGQTEITSSTYALAEQVGIDTARGWTYDILRTLFSASHPLTRSEIESLGNIPKTTCNQRLSDLRLFSVITSRQRKRIGAGRPELEYSPTEQLRNLWESAFPSEKKGTKKPKSKPSKPSQSKKGKKS